MAAGVILAGVGAGVNLFGGFLGARAAKKEARENARIARQEGAYQAGVSLHNAEVDRINSEESIRQGLLAARKLRKQGRAQKGGMKAAMSSAGLSSDSVTSRLLLMNQAREVDEERREMIRSAITEATSFESSSVLNTIQSRRNIILGEQGARDMLASGRNQATGSILGGVGGALSGVGQAISIHRT